MFDAESRQAWHLAKASYPGAIVFLAVDGLYVVIQDDARLLAANCGIDTQSRWLAFDPLHTRRYCDHLLGQGKRVVLVCEGRMREMTPTPRIRRPRTPKARFLAIDPLSLYERHELEAVLGADWLVEEFGNALRSRPQQVADFGTIYVYPVGHWFEVDAELTTMLPHHVKLLARTAFDIGRKVPCLVVEPKPRRRYGRLSKPKLPATPVPALGQLRLL